MSVVATSPENASHTENGHHVTRPEGGSAVGASTSSKKRKRDIPDAQAFSEKRAKTACVKMQDSFRCSICTEVAYVPVYFACGQHVACHGCIIDLVRNSCPIRLRSAPPHFVTHPDSNVDDDSHKQQQTFADLFVRCGKFKCVECNSPSTHDCPNMQKLIWPSSRNVSAFYNSEDVYECPYCPYQSCMSGLVRHVRNRECQVKIACDFCETVYTHSDADLQRHLMHECKNIKCISSPTCTFRGSLAQIVEHDQVHSGLDFVRDTFDVIFSSLRQCNFDFNTGTNTSASATETATQNKNRRLSKTLKQAQTDLCASATKIFHEVAQCAGMKTVDFIKHSDLEVSDFVDEASGCITISPESLYQDSFPSKEGESEDSESD